GGGGAPRWRTGDMDPGGDDRPARCGAGAGDRYARAPEDASPAVAPPLRLRPRLPAPSLPLGEDAAAARSPVGTGVAPARRGGGLKAPGSVGFMPILGTGRDETPPPPPSRESSPALKKNFVLDTNVLLHDPRSLFSFDDNNVVIPIYVIEEVDKFKRDQSELGRNSRVVARYLDAFRAEGSLAEGVPLPGGGLLSVVFTHRTIPASLGDPGLMDNRILAVALDVKERDLEMPTMFITKDTSLRIRADAIGLIAQDYDAQRVEISELYTGHTELFVSREAVDQIYRPGAEVSVPGTDGLAPNEFVQLKDAQNPSHTAMARMSAAKGKLVPLVRPAKEGVWGIRARNMEQSYTLDLLLNDEIKLVTIVGKAGTGKTLLAIASGLHKTTEEGNYQKLLVSRPIFPLGRDIGYLPGDVEQKLNPWMQ